MPQPATTHLQETVRPSKEGATEHLNPAPERESADLEPRIPAAGALDPDQAATTRLRFSPRERPVFEG